MKNFKSRGFTLIEALVSLAIFSLIAFSVYQAFVTAARLVRTADLMIASADLAGEQFEIIHNLPYTDVGTISGIPAGKLLASKNITRDNNNFLVETYISNIDDPFDGVIGGSPNDLSPADYKRVEVKISLPENSRFKPLSYSEFIAPKNLESASNNGALFIHVYDANGQPVPGASVHIENKAHSPNILIDDITNNSGDLQIIDAPPETESYEITVTKDGYSLDKTYPSGDPANPNPAKPHATVIARQVTEISFAIDLTSTVTVESVTETCAPVKNIDFSLVGAKQIGSEPTVLKYENSFATDDAGQKIISGLEWDNYTLTLTDSAYDLAGSISIIPFNLNPNSAQDIRVVAAPKNPRSVLFSVKQAGTQLPLSGVAIKLEKSGFSKELITGRGFLRQSDWSGGPGQIDYSDQTKYFNSDGNIETADPLGEVKLKKIFDDYAENGILTSSTFDTGSASNFYQLDFSPLDQPPDAGADSVRLKIATNLDNESWNYLGPDGTADTFYTPANLNINSVHNGDRYFRYQLYLQTSSTTFTPNVAEINFTFSSLCVPSGQTIFSGLDSGDYDLTISRDGFQTINDILAVSSLWKQQEITLMPQ